MNALAIKPYPDYRLTRNPLSGYDVNLIARLLRIVPQQAVVSSNKQYITFTVDARGMNTRQNVDALAEYGYEATFHQSYIIINRAEWCK